ncbi:DNA recombination and repair protein RecF [Candidatus Similichlamydia laticola]|uniref:DNA replication and repair protein RecF n=1 Tax=Candidatus Similichlamydia laticola TaxID=2170265 RepID=A0A369KKR3_9BACT|nr:DNA recombination and repair protein RecF [Candidatus Similichlamydia laticola]
MEAIGLLCSGRSFRRARYAELIQQGAKQFCLKMSFFREGFEHFLELGGTAQQRKITYNKQNITGKRLLLPVLFWMAEDWLLGSGPPALRRAFLDETLIFFDPLYAHHFTRYHRALLSRNRVLQSGQLADMEPWTETCIQSGGYLLSSRLQLLRSLQHKLKEGNIQLHYLSSSSLHEEGSIALRKSFLASEQQERRYRCTVCGPHRDDLEILRQGCSLRGFSSRGESFSAVLELKEAQWYLLQEHDLAPVILIDELGLGLDREALNRVLHFLRIPTQVIGTLTDDRLHLVQNFCTSILTLEMSSQKDSFLYPNL